MANNTITNKTTSEVTITNETVNGLMETIRNLYLADDIPWVIGYSGGKDSTATLQLVWLSLKSLPKEKLHKKVHIINTDTLVESPVVASWAKKSLEMMRINAEKDDLPFVPHRLIPDYDNSFWVNFIGRGYPFPRKKFRWCTDRLKIKPVNKFVKEKIAEHGEIILVLGTRKAESANRAKTMAYYEKKRVRELLSPSPSLANELVFSPLAEWNDNDVWVFLMQYPNPWGYSNQELLTLYRGATADGECPMMVEKDLPSCGRSRFGCWVCTMVARDQSMEAMIANDDEKVWMSPLLEFRNYFGDEELDRERRIFRRSSGEISGSYGRLYHGPYTKEAREDFLRRLLEVQEEVRNLCPPEFENLDLITQEELRIIRRIWVLDKHEFEDSLPRIYEEVVHEEFADPEWLLSTQYNLDEWDLLQEVCNELYPEEELLFESAYSVLDEENRAIISGDRSGLLKALEKTIRQTAFKDEEDATAFYLAKSNRKKEYGGSYDERFMTEYGVSKSLETELELVDEEAE